MNKEEWRFFELSDFFPEFNFSCHCVLYVNAYK